MNRYWQRHAFSSNSIHDSLFPRLQITKLPQLQINGTSVDNVRTPRTMFNKGITSFLRIEFKVRRPGGVFTWWKETSKLLNLEYYVKRKQEIPDVNSDSINKSRKEKVIRQERFPLACLRKVSFSSIARCSWNETKASRNWNCKSNCQLYVR